MTSAGTAPTAVAEGIEVTGVRRSFGSVHAVQDVTLHARPGAVTGLVGPNGSGKTTLLLMLASLLAPDAGRIRLDGVDPIADPHAARARTGWMPDALGAWGTLTARETLVMTGRLYGLTKADAAARAETLLREVGLVPLADAPARVFSRGQKQRLGLARALVHDPRVLLLDEPASGLDPQARVELRVLLRRMAAEGRTILVSSHILSELEEVVDDAVFLVDGRSVDAERVAAAASRTRPWRIRIAGDAAVAESAAANSAAWIADVLGRDAESVTVDRRDLLIAFASESEAAQALRTLVTADVPVVEFAAAQGSLERTFLDLGVGSGVDPVRDTGADGTAAEAARPDGDAAPDAARPDGETS